MTILARGTDSSGRTIRASREMWKVWDAACAELGFTPTIVQGGFMGSAAASASAGTHGGDALDVRLWDRTSAERAAMIHVFRSHGLAYWERYESQGFDLHAHMIPGPWASPSAGALQQWTAYLNRRDGLANNGPDYHWRPAPLVTKPPQEEDIVASIEDLRKVVREEIAQAGLATKAQLASLRQKEAQRFVKEIKEQRAQGKDLDAILSELEKG